LVRNYYITTGFKIGFIFLPLHKTKVNLANMRLIQWVQ